MVAFCDCSDKPFVKLTGNTTTHIQIIEIHLIDCAMALKVKLIHYTDSVDSPIQEMQCNSPSFTTSPQWKSDLATGGWLVQEDHVKGTRVYWHSGRVYF